MFCVGEIFRSSSVLRKIGKTNQDKGGKIFWEVSVKLGLALMLGC